MRAGRSWKAESGSLSYGSWFLGRNPEELYVFEDALYAIQTAKLAGYHTVGVYDEESKEDQEMIREEADIYMESFKEADIFFK